MLLDTHFHLDFLREDERAGFVESLADHGIGIIAQTLLPTDFLEQLPGPAPLALGFHPWQATSAELIDAQLAAFTQALPHTRLIGEVGLDFSPRRLETAPTELQLRAFRGVLSRLVGDQRVLSIHSVHSTADVVAEIEAHSPPIVPIFHWFSGTSDELTAIRDIGGYISVNSKMLSTKKGRAYLRQFPADRILLETDLPSHPDADADVVLEEATQQLAEVVMDLSEIKGCDMKPTILQNQRQVYPDL
ncbi:TatD family hydrolase [Staphylococcus chromogenes]|nr:TatD family hydrolase [Staphylococcus chromogenes]